MAAEKKIQEVKVDCCIIISEEHGQGQFIKRLFLVKRMSAVKRMFPCCQLLQAHALNQHLR